MIYRQVSRLYVSAIIGVICFVNFVSCTKLGTETPLSNPSSNDGGNTQNSIKKIIINTTPIPINIMHIAPPSTSGTIYGPYKDTGINLFWWENNNIPPNYGVATYRLGIGTTGAIIPPGTPPTYHLLDFFKDVIKISPDTVTWAFATGDCSAEDWSGIGSTSPDAISVFIKNNQSDFRAKNQNYIVSTGGAAAIFTCNSGSATDMKKFIDKYRYLPNTQPAQLNPNFFGIDFDIEDPGYPKSGKYTQTQIVSLIKSIAEVQQADPSLRVSFTLATIGADLSQSPIAEQNQLGALGTFVIAEANKYPNFQYIVNLMVMDYGTDAGSCHMKNGKCGMYQSAVNAAQSLNKYFQIPLSRIELTPMIGVNDDQEEFFTISDATKLAKYVKDNQLAGLHYWSIDRDFACTSFVNQANPPNVCTWVKPTEKIRKPSNYDLREPKDLLSGDPGYADFTKAFHAVFH